MITITESNDRFYYPCRHFLLKIAKARIRHNQNVAKSCEQYLVALKRGCRRRLILAWLVSSLLSATIILLLGTEVCYVI